MRVKTVRDGRSFPTYRYISSQVGTDSDFLLYLLGLVPSDILLYGEP